MTVATMTSTELLQERQDASFAMLCLEEHLQKRGNSVASGKTVTELIRMNQEVIAAIDAELERRTANLLKVACTDMVGE